MSHSPSPPLNFHRAKKRFSQNYLKDPQLLKKIIEAAGVQEGDQVLEVGPGPGALTRALLEAKAEVTAIELDRRFISDLKSWNDPHLTIIEGDILKLPIPLVDRCVANIPYQITTPLLEKLLPLQIPLTLTLQKEVAIRITSRVGSEDYSPLSLFCQYYATPRLLFDIKRTLFTPAPNVDSTVIHFTPSFRPAFPALFETIRVAFQARRKMIRQFFSEEALLLAGIDPTSRPQALSCNAYEKLTKVLQEREDLIP
jgi:16S rRNA (adenine1518-N6/adenine1519-N6)-dimethyltransferase